MNRRVSTRSAESGFLKPSKEFRNVNQLVTPNGQLREGMKLMALKVVDKMKTIDGNLSNREAELVAWLKGFLEINDAVDCIHKFSEWQIKSESDIVRNVYEAVGGKTVKDVVGKTIMQERKCIHCGLKDFKVSKLNTV